MNNTEANRIYTGSSQAQKVLRRSRERAANITIRRYGSEAVECLTALGYLKAAPALTECGDPKDTAYEVTPAGQDAPTRLLTVKA